MHSQTTIESIKSSHEDQSKRLKQAVVYIVDDDEQVRNSIQLVAHSIQLNSEAYSSAKAFLDNFRPGIPACLVLDVYLPNYNGVDLLEELRERDILIPTIVITAYGEVPTAVRAMKAGAIDFVQKPFSRDELIDLIQRALIGSIGQRTQSPESIEASQRLSRLSPCELDIMHLFFAGENTKSIASRLGISPKTVDYHRWNILKKMHLSSMVELAHYVARFIDSKF